MPELTLSGYAVEDLLGQDALLDAVLDGLGDIVAASADLLPVIIVGAPLRHDARLFNTAVAIHRGRVLGVVPKIHLPTYREFYERRQFASGDGIVGQQITIADQRVPFGTDLLFDATDVRGLRIGIEICEDMFVPVPPSSGLALAGATVLANLSGSPITIGRADTRSVLCRTQSMRCLAGYLYAAAGQGESTTDLSWDGQTSIFENGVELATGARFEEDPQLTIADLDLDLLRQERARQGTFEDNRRAVASGTVFRTVEFALAPPDDDLGLRRTVERFPFVPADPARLAQDCYEAYNIQVDGLAQRLRAIRTDKVVIGVSGGLDSTHALIVAARAMDLLGLPRSNILGYTMPGFATGDATKSNAWKLMTSLGISAHELDIRPTATQMLKGLDHPFGRGEEVYDVTFENVQAGLRTDYLFRLANHRDAIVLGTGDLSELALGWCTYGVGDQMSHYNVNGGVPKTLIQHLIRWVSGLEVFAGETRDVLLSILNTEISPELIPVKPGEVPQSTEKSVGPYELQDFNLFYTLRFGFAPVQDRLPVVPRLAGRRCRGLATGVPVGAAPGVRHRRHPRVVGRLRAAVLRVRAVQAVRDAERPEGVARRFAQPTRRLAGTVGRQRRRVVGRHREERAPGVRLDSGREESRGVGGVRTESTWRAEQMRVVITGGAGFLGTRLAEALAGQGHPWPTPEGSRRSSRSCCTTSPTRSPD